MERLSGAIKVMVCRTPRWPRWRSRGLQLGVRV